MDRWWPGATVLDEMPFLLCWFLHRATWTILLPGLLPLHLDAVAYCPTCDAGRGHKTPQRHTFGVATT